MAQIRKPATTSCKHGVLVNKCVICILWSNGKCEPSGSRSTMGSGRYDRNGMCKYSKHGVCDHYESLEVIEIEMPDEDLREGINYLLERANREES